MGEGGGDGGEEEEEEEEEEAGHAAVRPAADLAPVTDLVTALPRRLFG